MKSMIQANNQGSDEKLKKLTADLTKIIASMKDHIKMYKSSPENKDSPKTQDTTIVVPATKKAPPLEGGHYTNIGGMWTLKYEISPPTFYELLIKRTQRR